MLKLSWLLTQSPSPCWMALVGTSSPSDPNPLVCRVLIRPRGAREIERALSYWIKVLYKICIFSLFVYLRDVQISRDIFWNFYELCEKNYNFVKLYRNNVAHNMFFYFQKHRIKVYEAKVCSGDPPDPRFL